MKRLLLFVLVVSLLALLSAPVEAARYSTGVELLDRFFFPYASGEKKFVWNDMLAELKEAGFIYRVVEGLIEVVDRDNLGFVLLVTPLHNADGSHDLFDLYYVDENPPSYVSEIGVKVEFRDSGKFYYINVEIPSKQDQVGSLGDIEAYLRGRMAGRFDSGASRRGVISGDRVRMRAAPNTNAPIIHHFRLGLALAVLDIYKAEHERHPWYQVRFYDDIGWVYGEFFLYRGAAQPPHRADSTEWIAISSGSRNIRIPAAWTYDISDENSDWGIPGEIRLADDTGSISLYVGYLVAGGHEIYLAENPHTKFLFDSGEQGYMVERPDRIVWLHPYWWDSGVELWHDGDRSVFTDNEDLILRIVRTLTN